MASEHSTAQRQSNRRDATREATTQQGPAITLGVETLTLELISRATAELWLEHRAANRNMSKGDIARYRDTFLSLKTDTPKWHPLASEALSFNADGQLTNGQKRLSGFLAANVPSASFLILRSTSAQTLAAMGTGRPQSLRDQLTRLGYLAPELVTALVRPLHAALQPAPVAQANEIADSESVTPAVSVVEQAQTADAHRTFIRAMVTRSGSDELLRNPKVFAAFWPLALVPQKSAKAFIDEVMEAPGELKGGSGSVATVVRHALSRARERAQLVATANLAQRDRTAVRRAPRRDLVQELAAAVLIGYTLASEGRSRISKGDLDWTPGRSRSRPTPFPEIPAR